MGYCTRWDGELDLSRQLTLNEYNELDDLLDRDFKSPSCSYGNAWHSFGINRKGTQITTPEDSGKTYYWKESLQFIIDWLGAKDIKLNGRLKWFGEEAGDLGKVTVVDSVITVTDLGAQVRALMNE